MRRRTRFREADVRSGLCAERDRNRGLAQNEVADDLRPVLQPVCCRVSLTVDTAAPVADSPLELSRACALDRDLRSAAAGLAKHASPALSIPPCHSGPALAILAWLCFDALFRTAGRSGSDLPLLPSLLARRTCLQGFAPHGVSEDPSVAALVPLLSSRPDGPPSPAALVVASQRLGPSDRGKALGRLDCLQQPSSCGLDSPPSSGESSAAHRRPRYALGS